MLNLFLDEETRQQGRDMLKNANSLLMRLTGGTEITEKIDNYRMRLRRHSWTCKSSGIQKHKHRYEAIVLDISGNPLVKHRTRSSERFLAFYLFCIAPFIEQLKSLKEEIPEEKNRYTNQRIINLKEHVKQDHEMQAKAWI